MEREIIVGEFYHTYNRGVEKRKIFLDEKDYFRSVHDLYEFNDANATANVKYHFSHVPNYGDPISYNKISYNKISYNNGKKREMLIKLNCWELMPNHFHLFSAPIVNGGLAKFHQKFGIGFTGYFNLKYKRDGVLFQGKYKKVQVTNDIQAGHLICYIHSNPLDIWKPNWKETGLTVLELQNALKFLEQYRWSSHQDYLGIKNFPSLIDTEFLFNFFDGPNGYRNFFVGWLKQYGKNIEFIKKVTLE